MPNFSGVWNLKEQIQAIAAGRWTGLPLPELYAWGRNLSGQLGDLTVVYRSSPVQVGDDPDWAQASAANGFSLSVKTNGTLWAWGDNGGGQLGLNTLQNHSSPIQVGALTNWSEVFARTTALKTDGTLWTWGGNNRGEVGDGTTIDRSSPVQVGLLTDWAQTDGSYGNHNAAVTTGNELYTWGYNSLGQLGHNNVISRSSPVQVGALADWAQVSTGSSHTGAVKTNGTMWMWGGNYRGQLGVDPAGSPANRRSSPVQVGALTNWAQLSLGDNHTGAVKTDGTLWMWGQGSFGRLGDGAAVNRSSPVQIGALTGWVQVAAGNLNSFAVKTDGTLWGWGYGGSGNLGQNNTATTSSPVQIGTLPNWTRVSVKNQHVLAIFQGTTN